MLDRIRNDLRQAQLSHDEIKVSTLRLLLSEVKNEEISKGGFLSDNEVIAVIQQEIKKRKEAAAGFRAGGREESALREELEAKVLRIYLPAQISNEELTKLVEDTINELGASSLADMGKVMGVVMGKVAGRADGSQVSGLVKDKLLSK